ncbi:MAG: substrate-binding domain-containing protein [Acidimicrobiales bacterium]
MIPRWAFAVAAVAVLAVTVDVSPASAAGAKVTGGGASFPQLELEQWRADVSGPPYNLSIDYQAAGSTFGRQKYLAGQLDYGVSDIPFQPEEMDQLAKSPRRNFVYVPVSAGGLGFMYNVIGLDGRRITNLRLSQESVCRVFTEDEIYWDDPGLVADNPGVPLPHDRVRPVARSDGSGTSYVLSEFCISTAPAVWSKFIGLVKAVAPSTASSDFSAGAPTSQWPSGYGAVGVAFASDGVANTVANDVAGKSTITYVEAGFAKERGFPNALVRNSAGVYNAPDSPNVTVALGFATGRADGTFDLDYLAGDPKAYFPSSYSYVIAQTTGFDPAKGATLSTFLNYAVTAGQKRAESLGYARLSTVLVNLALDQIARIPGAGPRPTDLQGAPPPPRAIDTSKIVPGATAGAVAAGATPPVAAAGAAPASGAAAAAGPAASAAAATEVAGASVTRGADGRVRLDAGQLAAGASASAAGKRTAPGTNDPISDKETLWYFAIGAGLVALARFGRALA